MLVQERSAGDLRLFEQHEHGLVSGELAAAWRVPPEAGPLSQELVLATALHDLGWKELDEAPLWNPETRLPHDFRSFPAPERYQAAARGIDWISELHPYAGVLVSLHYAALGKETAPADFLEEEENRRLALLAELGPDAPSAARMRRDLARLQLLDRMSLHLCLASPDALPGSIPEWLARDRFEDADGHGPVRARWLSSRRIEIDPFPFEGREVELEIAYRDLEGAPYESAKALAKAWKESEDGTLSLLLLRP